MGENLLGTNTAIEACLAYSLRSRQRCERRLAGAAGLEPVTSAVTGQRSNQLSYTPAMGVVKLKDASGSVKPL